MRWLALLLLTQASSLAATLEVGSGKTYATIALALAAASASDTVSVYDGTYSESPTVSLTGLTIAAAAGNAPWLVGRIVVNQSNVTVRGIGIGGWTNANAGGVHVSGYDGLTVENCTITNAGSATGSGVYTRDAANVLIRSNLIAGNATGVNINSGVGTSYADGVRILANTIATNYFDGIDMHGRYITVEGNTIFRNYDTNWLATHPDGIQLIDSTIDGHQGCQDVKIVRNLIYSHPQNIFGGYYTTNILIANNVFYSESGTVNGLDLDSVTTKHVGLYSGSGILVANNAMGRALSAGVYVSYNAAQAVGGVSVQNNILDGITGGAIGVYFVNAADVGTWNWNLYGTNSYAGRIAASYYADAAAIRAETAHEDNGVDGDPLWVDYVPAVGSPAIGAGADLSAFFTDDYTGRTRVVPWDIGAYEYGRTAQIGTATVGTLIIGQ